MCMICILLQELTTQLGAGTFAGMVEKLDYLQHLGINCVELLPSQEFNELEYYSVSFTSNPFLLSQALDASSSGSRS